MNLLVAFQNIRIAINRPLGTIHISYKRPRYCLLKIGYVISLSRLTRLGLFIKI